MTGDQDHPAFVSDLTDAELEELIRAKARAEKDDGAALELAGAIGDLEAEAEPRAWRSAARPDQLPPEEEWTVLHYRGGRGAGKGFGASHVFREMIAGDPLRQVEGPGEFAVVAPSFGAARDVCAEGPTGVLAAFGTNVAEVAAGRSRWVKTWNRSHGLMILRDGTRIYFDGADDGARSIQGKNLRGVWADEIGLWRQWEMAWDESIGFALRKGESKIVASGTPKANLPARALVRRLLDDPAVVNRRLRTEDNLDNLSPAYRARFEAWRHTRLGVQELEGELVDSLEGALWRWSWINENRVATYDRNHLRRVVLGLDPSDGKSAGAGQGLAVVGLGRDGRAYVYESRADRLSPHEWLREVIALARSFHQSIPMQLVVERNHGAGFLEDLLEQAFRTLGQRLPVQMVTASRSKTERALPVAGLYETGRVRHVGHLTELEDELTTWTGAQGEPSPDRLDALVHAIAAIAPQLLPRDDDDSIAAGERAVPYSDYADVDDPDAAVAWSDADESARPGTWAWSFGAHQ